MGTGSGARFGPPPGGVTVVLVEEHPVLLERFTAQLADAGLRVVAAAGTLAAGLDAVLRLRPDVAVVGDGLPDGRGIELCRSACGAVPRLVVLLHAALVTPFEELEAKEAGVAAVVPKAIRGAALVAAVLAHAPGGG
jgi:DNA-binding NarL/FixJ family response regulator